MAGITIKNFRLIFHIYNQVLFFFLRSVIDPVIVKIGV